MRTPRSRSWAARGVAAPDAVVKKIVSVGRYLNSSRESGAGTREEMDTASGWRSTGS